MRIQLARDSRQLTRQLALLAGFLFVLALVLLLLSAIGSGEDEELARQRRINTLRQNINRLEQQVRQVTFPPLSEARERAIQVLTLAGQQGLTIVSYTSVETKERIGSQDLAGLFTNVELEGSPEELLFFLEELAALGDPATVVDSIDWKAQSADRTNLKLRVKTFIQSGA